jgi:hypothetical protein
MNDLIKRLKKNGSVEVPVVKNTTTSQGSHCLCGSHCRCS